MSIANFAAIVSLVVLLQPQPGKPADAPPAPSAPSKDAKGDSKTEASSDKAKGEARRKSDAVSVIQSARRLSEQCDCSRCEGTGVVVKDIRVGEREAAPGMTEAVYAPRLFRCDACSGAGLARHESVQQAARNFIQKIDTYPEDDKRYDKTMDTIKSELRTAAQKLLKPPKPWIRGRTPAKDEGPLTRAKFDELNTRAQQDEVLAAMEKWQTRFNDKPISELSGTKPRLGEPYVVIGTLLSDVQRADLKARTQSVDIGNKVVVELEGAKVVDALVGDKVVVGGVLISRATADAGRPKAVLRGGFVVRAQE